MGYFEIHNAVEFAFAFESGEELTRWLIDAHNEYDFEDVSELKQLFIDNELHDYYIIVKKFEEQYIN